MSVQGEPRPSRPLSTPPLDALDPPELRARRDALVNALVMAGDVRTPAVADAMRAVPRHLFVPEGRREAAYDDAPVLLGSGQTISQPTIVGRMTEALALEGGERVLEIGTGSGYQAAILARLCREVFTVERLAGLGKRAAIALAQLGCDNVHVRIGDGFEGWPEHAPYDRAILTAAPPEIPRAVVDQLAEGGVLVCPVGPAGGDLQMLVRGVKQRGTMRYENLCRVTFVPMITGVGAQESTWN